MSPRLVAAFALTAALAASIALLFADTYSGQTCSSISGRATECVGHSSTLVEQHGRFAVGILAVPVLIVGAIGALVRLEGPPSLTLGLAVTFLFLCGIASASVGLFYMPAGGLALAAAVMQMNRRTRARAAPAARE